MSYATPVTDKKDAQSTSTSKNTLSDTDKKTNSAVTSNLYSTPQTPWTTHSQQLTPESAPHSNRKPVSFVFGDLVMNPKAECIFGTLSLEEFYAKEPELKHLRFPDGKWWKHSSGDFLMGRCTYTKLSRTDADISSLVRLPGIFFVHNGDYTRPKLPGETIAFKWKEMVYHLTLSCSEPYNAETYHAQIDQLFNHNNPPIIGERDSTPYPHPVRKAEEKHAIDSSATSYLLSATQKKAFDLTLSTPVKTPEPKGPWTPLSSFEGNQLKVYLPGCKEKNISLIELNRELAIYAQGVLESPLGIGACEYLSLHPLSDFQELWESKSVGISFENKWLTLTFDEEASPPSSLSENSLLLKNAGPNNTEAHARDPLTLLHYQRMECANKPEVQNPIVPFSVEQPSKFALYLPGDTSNNIQLLRSHDGKSLAIHAKGTVGGLEREYLYYHSISSIENLDYEAGNEITTFEKEWYSIDFLPKKEEK